MQSLFPHMQSDFQFKVLNLGKLPFKSSTVQPVLQIKTTPVPAGGRSTTLVFFLHLSKQKSNETENRKPRDSVQLSNCRGGNKTQRGIIRKWEVFFVNHPPWNSVFSLPTSSVRPHCCSSCETKQDSLPLTGLLLSSICDDVAFLSLINWAWCFNTPVETFPQTIMWLDFILQQDNEPDHTSKISKKRERPGNLYGLLPEKHRLCLEETKLSNTRLCVVFQPDDADEREAETFQTFLSILPLRSCFCLPLFFFSHSLSRPFLRKREDSSSPSLLMFQL